MNTFTKILANICIAAGPICFTIYHHETILPWILWLCCIVLKIAVYITVAILSAAYAVYQHKPKSKNTPKIALQPSEHILQKTKEKLVEYKYIPKKSVKQKALISRNVDDVIDELIGLLLRDYINSWFTQIVRERSMFCNNLKPVIRQMLFTFRDRCHAIDDIKFFTSDLVDIVHKHLQNIKSSEVGLQELIVPYKVYPFLEHKEMELDYLRQITEFLLITLLPPPYAECKPLRHLLREVFAGPVFSNVIEKTCDPDSINLKLIAWLRNQHDAAEQHRRLYSAAETYEDFVKLVRVCNSIEGLQQWRYYIVVETMAANTISDFKCAKGVEADKEFNTQKRNKGDLLEARNLPQYLNQLHFSKRLCEKRLKDLGGPDYLSPSSSKSSINQSLEDKIPISCRKVLSMASLMQSSNCRKHYSKYLQKEEMHSLIGFWEAVEEMKVADKSILHQMANDIVQMYVHNQASAVRLSKNTLKGIEEFMMANKGPEAFSQAQDEVYKQLDERFYASFIVSDIYHKMVAEAAKQGVDFTHSSDDDCDNDDLTASQALAVKSDNSDVSLFEHSSYARTQLRFTQEKLNDKLRALQALKSNPKCDKKVTAVLDKEIRELRTEQSLLQNHIEKTELWIKYLGLWQTTVVQAEVTKENDKTIPYFNIMIHLSNEANHPHSASVGWIVPRNLAAFYGLHQKLVPAATWLKKIELPTRPRFKSLDEAFLEKTKSSLQTFLSAVTKDDGLNKSEALYTFLSPSPEHMKHPPGPQKKTKFNFLQLLKGVQIGFRQPDDGPEEELLFLDDIENKGDARDSIAEPLYGLISEIFELKGVFNWLRRSLITFVQQAYGKTINRQIRESVSYIVSEPMLLTYLQMFRDTMWPTSPTSPVPPAPRTEAEMLQTKIIAKQMLLDSIPEVIVKMVGQQDAKKGVTKLFNALQNQDLNKQLLYNILEAFLFEYAPELRKGSSRTK